MTIQITHMNFGWLHAPPLPPACCHCLLIRGDSGVLLVDTGIGTHDIADPITRIGQEAIDAAGFQLIPAVTAKQQLGELGIAPDLVSDIVLTHCDPDHVGGLADFPDAKVHVAMEEKRNLESGNQRYRLAQFSHNPRWVTYEDDDCETLGLPSRRINTHLDIDIRLVPLFGHTSGHCGVAIHSDKWLIHAGDAYYLREELCDASHPVGELATLRADNNVQRLDSMNSLQNTIQQNTNATCFGYHDVSELPIEIPTLRDFE